MTQTPPTVLSVLRDRVRRGQLIVGVGGFSAAFGAVLVSPVVAALVPWMQKGRSPILGLFIHIALSRFWVYAVLPALWLALSRWLRDLRPWRTAIGSALVGESFFLVLDWMGGALRASSASLGFWALRLATLGVGIVLSAKAITWRRAA